MQNFNEQCEIFYTEESKVRDYAAANNLHAGAIVGWFTGEYLEGATQQQVNAVGEHFYSLFLNTNQYTGDMDEFTSNPYTAEKCSDIINAK